MSLADPIKAVLVEARAAMDAEMDPPTVAVMRAQFDQLLMETRAAGFNELLVGAVCMMGFINAGLTPTSALALVDYCADVRPAPTL